MPKAAKPAPSRAADLHAITIVTAPDAAEAVGELLLRTTGESPVLTHDRVTGLATAAVYAQNGGAWVLPDAGPVSPARLRTLLRTGLRAIADCGLDPGPARIAFRRVPALDWRESWKRHFKPLAIGRHLLVRATWHRRRPVPGQAEIILDPGLSFGTGQHPTTEFCLREIARLRPRAGRSASLLDVGTGSGILAIAATRLGYAPVEGFDFDPEAIGVARENAQANRAEKALRLRVGDVARLPARPARPLRRTVVCANLTADLLLKHAARLAAHVEPGGHLLLAGILATEFAQVRTAFSALGLVPSRDARKGEWHSGSFERPI